MPHYNKIIPQCKNVPKVGFNLRDVPLIKHESHPAHGLTSVPEKVTDPLTLLHKP